MRQWTIDAFAAGPFRGNPACVVEPFDAWPDAGWMQALAAENNQAETAFLLRTADPGRFGLRWFTPKVEIDLCGHATLASAHALRAELGLAAETLAFDTRSGRLGVRRHGAGYEMDFPAQPAAPVPVPRGVAEALGVEVREAWASTYLMCLLADEAAVRAAAPDMAKLRLAAGAWKGAVGVAALADEGEPYDVVDRFFAPGLGVDEDPATGAMHCALSPIYAAKLGRATARFHQACPGRGGDLECEHRGDRVMLRGAAVTVIEGRLRLAPPDPRP